MKVKVSVEVEFEPDDEETCGPKMAVAREYHGKPWESIAECLAMVIRNLRVPRPEQLVAQLVNELESEIPSGETGVAGGCLEMLNGAGRVIDAFAEVDKLVASGKATAGELNKLWGCEKL